MPGACMGGHYTCKPCMCQKSQAHLCVLSRATRPHMLQFLTANTSPLAQLLGSRTECMLMLEMPEILLSSTVLATPGVQV
jgi:hypothetical protein